MKQLAERLKNQRVAMLTLRDGSGRLSSRPLTPLQMDAEGALWMMVSKKALSALFAQGPQAANLAFSNVDDSVFVSISGQARLVDDRSRKEQLWTAAARPWFSGPDDPDLSLLSVLPEEADVWDGPGSSVMRVLAMAASVAAGKSIGLGEHERLKTKADVKMNRQMTEARSDSEETKLKADYKLAAERCDTLSGDAKDSCTASAKARYGM